MKLVILLEVETDLETLVEDGYVEEGLVKKLVDKTYTKEDIETLKEQIKDAISTTVSFIYDIKPKIIYSEVEELQD